MTGTPSAVYSVQSLPVGRAHVPGPMVYWMTDWFETYELCFQVVAITNDKVKAVVNTGPPPDLSNINEAWQSSLGEEAGIRRTPEQRIDNALNRAGLAFAEVTHVILTPLQSYTTGNLEQFVNAEICVSKRGWTQLHTTHDHPHDDRWSTFTPDQLRLLVTDGWDRVRLLEDEDVIVPGVRTWWSGGHHRASIAIEADTDAGTVVISDTFFHYGNVEENRPLGISENIYECLEAYKRARKTADHMLPLYDPAVLTRYPKGVIGAV